MPSERDAYFHEPQFQEYNWLETNWFCFSVPEETLQGWVYNCFRPLVGTVFSLVVIWTGDCTYPFQTDYWDCRPHLPMPNSNLDHYRLENGVEVEAVEPLQTFRIDYEGRDDTELHLTLEGLTDPFDEKEFMAEAGKQDQEKEFAEWYRTGSAGDISMGHLDQPMWVTGDLVVRGEHYEVDYAGSRDHSWGPRPQIGHTQGNFDKGYFGRDFGFHVKTENGTTPDGGTVMNGYVYEGDDIHLLTEGESRFDFDRNTWRIDHLEYELTDTRGKEYEFVAEPVARAPIPTMPNLWSNIGLVRWQFGDRRGWGEYQWTWGVDELQKFQQNRL